LFNCVAATIKDRNQAKLKLECIAFDEGTIEHVDGMAKKRSVLRPKAVPH
jgi:hypothetical protein